MERSDDPVAMLQSALGERDIVDNGLNAIE